MRLVIFNSFVILTADCVLQQTIANAQQISDVEERIESLGEPLASPVGVRDAEELARRTVLKKFVFLLQESLVHLIAFVARRKLVRIITELGPLSEQLRLAKFLMNADNADKLKDLVQDLADAVLDYQVCCPNSVVWSL